MQFFILVDLAGCIAALERRREAVLFSDVDSIATHGGRQGGVGEDGSDGAIERGHGGGPCVGVADNLGFRVLELDPCGVSLTALADRALGDASDIVGGAAPRVAGNDPCNQGVERGDVLNRLRRAPALRSW